MTLNTFKHTGIYIECMLIYRNGVFYDSVEIHTKRKPEQNVQNLKFSAQHTEISHDTKQWLSCSEPTN